MWQRSRRSPEVVAQSGVSRTFQNIRLFQTMTALENVLVGMDRNLRVGFFESMLRLPRHFKEKRQAVSRAREMLEFVGLVEYAGTEAGCLPYGHQRRLEIARALASGPTLLLLDEPAAGMNPSESVDLMELINKIKSKGITVLLIEHHMRVVMGISDRIAVLDYGNKIAEGTPEEIRANEKVISAYLGKA
ncbi:MAG: ABC transporter ATP-binding protein [Bdellovibrionota bacterium]